MKTMILDDGWQKVDSRTFYSATGDWMPVTNRFPNMKAHVAAVHKAGLKYMLWLAVPFMGDEAKNYPKFKGMMLRGGDTGVLDPRFPEVREYLISTYERVVGEWDFDGVKLDFIDNFVLPKNDPALKDNYAGRDYRSLPDAVNRLMKDVLARLKKIKPDVLVEFRQHYMGTAILQYGNMMRCADCPADPTANRKRVCDLRLTSGGIAVHSGRDAGGRGASDPERAVLDDPVFDDPQVDPAGAQRRDPPLARVLPEAPRRASAGEVHAAPSGERLHVDRRRERGRARRGRLRERRLRALRSRGPSRLPRQRHGRCGRAG